MPPVALMDDEPPPRRDARLTGVSPPLEDPSSPEDEEEEVSAPTLLTIAAVEVRLRNQPPSTRPVRRALSMALGAAMRGRTTRLGTKKTCENARRGRGRDAGGHQQRAPKGGCAEYTRMWVEEGKTQTRSKS